jgi:hypothetical protein
MGKRRQNKISNGLKPTAKMTRRNTLLNQHLAQAVSNRHPKTKLHPKGFEPLTLGSEDHSDLDFAFTKR